MKLFVSIVLAILLTASVSYSQSIGNYSTARSTGIAYSSISSTGNAIGNWRNTGSLQQDDNRSYPHDIGFDFWYNGTRYTQFSVSTNGYIDFSSSTANGKGTGAYGYQNTQFTGNGSGTWLSLAPMYDDMTAQGGVAALGNSIKYLTSGSAPNRVLTVEWINMAVYGNTTPSLNFQIKLYETSGVVEFLYGTMNSGSHSFSYTLGINAATLNNTPTIAQLKAQQVANTNTFSNGQTNNLSTVPASNSKITFTPPTTSGTPSGALTFTSVGQTGMTLNWTNWCTNEVGYVIYNSTDGVNYSYIAQTGVNATSYSASGLLPSTNYFWRLCAVTEGYLSSTITGAQSTLPASNKISIKTGNWSDPTTWSPNGVPTAGDNVTINNAHTVTIDVTNSICNSLVVGNGVSGVLRYGNNNTARQLSVNGNVTVNNGASFTVNTSSNTTHSLFVLGNVLNNGVLNFAPDNNSFCDVTFNKSGNQTLSGTGSVALFNMITANLGSSVSNTLTISVSNFSAPNYFLTLTSGTVVFSLTNTGTISLASAAFDITSNAGLKFNSPSFTFNFLDDINLYGVLTIDTGIVNVGNANNENIVFNGGTLNVNGGALNLAGRIYTANINTTADVIITGGVFTLPVYSSTSTTIAPFTINSAGSSLNMSGGTLVIRREGGNGAQDLGYEVTGASNVSVTGGVLQIGNAGTPSGQTMKIITNAGVSSLKVNSANATAIVNTYALDVTNDITIQQGTLNSNNLDVTLGGNWLNAGGTFVPGTATVILNGDTQSITKAVNETFYHLQLLGTGLKYLGGPISVARNITINNGVKFDVSINNYNVFIGGNWTNNGTFIHRKGTVTFNGTTAQTYLSSSQNVFYNITLNNSAGLTQLNDTRLKGTLLLNNGVFNANSLDFIIHSDANGTGRIGPITGGDFSGNIKMQRYINSNKTDWRQIGSAVSGTTLADWNDEIVTSGFPGSDFPSNSFCSVYWYDETKTGTYTIGYTKPTSVNNPIVMGRGYYVYIGPVPDTLQVTGPPHKFSKTINLTYTNTGSPNDDGWNMVANPYPSGIDWDQTSWVKTNVANAIYVWNPALQQYASYVSGSAVNGGSKYIPSSQAFWVYATGSGASLQLNENVKTPVDTAFMKIQRLKNFSLVLNIKGNGGYVDQTLIKIDSSATASFDSQKDALKLWGGANNPAITTVVNGDKDLAINALPLNNNNEMVIPVRIWVPKTGNYTITLDSSSNIFGEECITIKDKLTNAVFDLKNFSSYIFNAKDTTWWPRFEIRISSDVKYSVKNNDCGSSPNGIIRAEYPVVSTFNWKDKNGNVLKTTPNVLQDSLINLPSGDYVLEISNSALACGMISKNIHISQPSVLSASITTQSATCNGLTDGSAAAVISGGNAPYSYSWSNGITASSISNVGAGVYTLYINDSLGCSDVVNVYIDAPEVMTASFSTVSPVCSYSTDGAAIVTVAGGSGSYSYSWSNNSTSQSILNAGLGLYIITVTDANGCSMTDSVVVEGPDPIDVNIDTKAISCFGYNDGVIIADANGGTPGYNYSWANGSTNNSLQNLSKGNYSLTITDASGCSFIKSVYLDEPEQIIPSFTLNNDTLLLPNASLSASNFTSGADEFFWHFGDGTSDTTINASHVYQNIGTYSVILYALNVNGCMDSLTQVVNVVLQTLTGTLPSGNLSQSDINAYFGNQSLNIQFNLSYQTNLSVKLFDLSGRLIYSEENIPSGKSNHSVPVYNISSGTYLLQVLSDGVTVKSLPLNYTH